MPKKKTTHKISPEAAEQIRDLRKQIRAKDEEIDKIKTALKAAKGEAAEMQQQVNELLDAELDLIETPLFDQENIDPDTGEVLPST